MQIHHILAGIFLFAGITNNTAEAQQLRKPMDIPVLLSGNFGELRSNHFHSGIDFKTQGVEGKPSHIRMVRLLFTAIFRNSPKRSPLISKKNNTNRKASM